jgi:hypothetical protein
MVGGALLALASMTGCAVKAVAYQPSIANVTTLKKSGTSAASVGAFSVQSGATGGSTISLRGNSMESPAGGNYAAYLAEALKMELDMAKRLDPKATIEISGVLLKNDVAAGGVSRNSGEIEARFVVKRDGNVRFDKTKRAVDEWDSSFAGAIAIPKAQQQYPVLVQTLLAALYADAEFQAAVR